MYLYLLYLFAALTGLATGVLGANSIINLRALKGYNRIDPYVLRRRLDRTPWQIAITAIFTVITLQLTYLAT